MEENTKVCSNCGFDMGSEQNSKSETNNKSKSDPVIAAKKNKNGSVVIISIAAALVVLIGIVFFMVSFGGYDRVRVSRLCELGDRYLSKLDYEQAIASYQAAIEIEPKCEEAYLGLADAYVGLGEFESAIRALEEGIAMLEDEEAKADVTEELRGHLAELQTEYETIKEAEQLAAEETAIEGETEETEEEAVVANRIPYADEMAAIVDASVGDIVYWGSYEQDNDLDNGTEPIEWYVLDKENGHALLFSVYILDVKPYNDVLTNITWENCSLRKWLNNEFYDVAFTAEEKNVIIDSELNNANQPSSDAEGGINTVDRVFCLSLDDMVNIFHYDLRYWEQYDDVDYFANICDARLRAPVTLYAESNGCLVWESYMDVYGYDFGIRSGMWWLRSPGYYSDSAVSVGGSGVQGGTGEVFDFGKYVDIEDFGVRPAINVAY